MFPSVDFVIQLPRNTFLPPDSDCVDTRMQVMSASEQVSKCVVLFGAAQASLICSLIAGPRVLAAAVLLQVQRQ